LRTSDVEAPGMAGLPGLDDPLIAQEHG
ncbi:MAG: hypothetical protein JWO57_903, partial [Pseudonocardiales bacterium]|nr:hypothetical protein [Pseudonocardiales bacterium]